MRIAFFTEAYDPFTNGVVVLVKAYRDALVRAGHEVVIFTPNHDDRPHTESGVVRVPSLKFARELYPVVLPFAGGLKHFEDCEFDILHSHHPFSCGLLAEQLSRKHDIPLVYTFHTLLTTQSHYVPGPKQIAEKTLLSVIRRHCARAHCVTVSTQVMRRWLLEHGVKSPIHLVRPNVPEFQPSPDARKTIRASFGFSDTDVVAFCASRLSFEKDLDLLLQAMARVPSHVNLKLLVAGGGPEEAELRALARKLRLGSRLQWAGEIRHEVIADYYAAADLFAFPSRNDTLGMVILEAMSAGLPCVVMDSNGPSEIVKHGISGLHSSYDANHFAHCLNQLASDPVMRKQMSDTAVVNCQAFCTPDTASGLMESYHAAQDMAHLDRLLGRKRGNAKPRRTFSGPRVW